MQKMACVDSTLHLLKGGLKRKLSSVDCSMLEDLYQELVLYAANFTVDGTNEFGDMLVESVHVLGEQVQNKDQHTEQYYQPNIINNATSPVRRKKEEHVPKLGIITTEIQEGKIIYLMDGLPIKFQHLKDSTVYHHRWEDNFQLLKEFYREFGHTNVTRSTPGNGDLGNWVTEQRRKLKRGKISQRQFERLNEIGMTPQSNTINSQDLNGIGLITSLELTTKNQRMLQNHRIC